MVSPSVSLSRLKQPLTFSLHMLIFSILGNASFDLQDWLYTPLIDCNLQFERQWLGTPLFPGGLVVRTQLPLPRARVQSLIKELKSHKPHDLTKRKRTALVDIGCWVQFSRSVMSDSATPWSTACRAPLVRHQLLEPTQSHAHWVSDAIQPSHPLSSITSSWSPPSPMSIESVMPSNHLILCHPSPAPGAHPVPCPLSQWCHPAISSSVIPFSCSQSFPASGSFPVSQLFASGGQNTGVSASASVLPTNTQDWSPFGWTCWISLQSKSLLQHHSSKASILQCSAFFIVQLSYPYMTIGKTIALTRPLLAKWCLCFLTCCLSWS